MEQTNTVLTCSGLSKNFGRTHALTEVSFNLYRGRVTGLVGPNGSGKTTFIKLAAGLLTPSSGSIEIDGCRIGTHTKSVVSYLPDRDYLPENMKVLGIIKLFDGCYKDFDPEKAMMMLVRLGIDLGKRFRQLSKGMREKVSLCMVMSRKAKLYLLDEPIAGVDPAVRDYILNTVFENRSEDSAVLISTHLISEIEPVIDDALMFQQGTVRCYDSAERLRRTTGKTIDQLFREVYRC